MIKTLEVVEGQHLQGFLIANDNYYLGTFRKYTTNCLPEL